MTTFSNSTTPGDKHAIVGVAEHGIGIHGTSATSTGAGGVSGSGIGVHGVSTAGPGVRGDATNGVGVFGASTPSTGVGGMSESGFGVHGVSTSGAGVVGNSERADGVVGQSTTARGVVGVAIDATGVEGNSTSGAGVFGSSQSGIGVHGKGGRLAALFEGDLEVTGDIRLANADCAEDFAVADIDVAEPGTVMVIGNHGALQRSEQAYDKRVTGVISGAGEYRPAIVLDRHTAPGNRAPIALLGKVYCKVDARYAPIEVGDLLTTSNTAGHAMKAENPLQAFGAVLGKALRPLHEGQGLIPILIALQ